ncbi:MAG TPA: YfhH family protein [Bacillales bacterium]|nr:YfhH family protein [Bacillales bacterium]
MDKRYSEMTVQELKDEIAELSEKARKAERLGIVNEFAVLQRKMTMAKAYMLDPSEFQPGETYEIEGDPGSRFVIDYLNGTFAWGYKEGSKTKQAFPISLLKKKQA